MIGTEVASHPLPDHGEVGIGRSEQSDVQINDPSISRRHALLRIGVATPLTLEDLASANGTRVRGRRLRPNEAVVISPDELVELGSVMMIVQHRSTPMRSRRLWTHDYFEGRLEDECVRAERSGSSFVLVRIHCNPEITPTAVQQALVDTTRVIDVVGLYAPGEYEALLVDTTPEEAAPVVRRLEDQLSQNGASVRIGSACYPRDGRSPDALVAKACRVASSEQAVADAGAAVVITDGTMRHLHRLVERIAQGMLSVLILGDTGVGKEIMAESVHRLSPRAQKPFLRLNCAALSESLLESELFGHERGAFTGAVNSKQGLLETAQGGTVFLDEVGELPMSIQVKLLRVIEERQVLRVGGLRPRPIDVRFVAATNRDLEAEVERGTFRQDLFFRLNGISIAIPPLRERVSEIESMARGFLGQACRQAGRPDQPQIAAEAMALLRQYSWPGNIRELRNVIERAVLLCSGDTITLEHLPVQKMRSTFSTRAATPPPAPTTPAPGAGGRALAGDRRARLAPPVPEPDEDTGPGAGVTKPISILPPDDADDPDEPLGTSMRREIEAVERQRIIEALQRCAGNQTQAARLLGISRRTLVNRLNAYAIARPRKGPPSAD